MQWVARSRRHVPVNRADVVARLVLRTSSNLPCPLNTLYSPASTSLTALLVMI